MNILETKKRVFDLHSHTNYSYCSPDDPHDLIKTAIENDIFLLGISDHNYGIGERKPEYLKLVRSLAEQYKEKIKILCGIEISTLPRNYDITSPDEIKDFDYCLIENITLEESFVKDKLFEFCKSLKIPCGIAHTDLFEYCDMYGFDYQNFYRKIAENNVFWELNVNYDSTHSYHEHEYVLDFIKDEEKQRIVKEAGAYLSIGFDSHRHKDYLGDRVHKIYDFLKSNNFNTIDEILLRKDKA